MIMRKYEVKTFKCDCGETVAIERIIKGKNRITDELAEKFHVYDDNTFDIKFYNYPETWTLKEMMDEYYIAEGQIDDPILQKMIDDNKFENHKFANTPFYYCSSCNKFHGNAKQFAKKLISKPTKKTTKKTTKQNTVRKPQDFVTMNTTVARAIKILQSLPQDQKMGSVYRSRYKTFEANAILR